MKKFLLLSLCFATIATTANADLYYKKSYHPNRFHHHPTRVGKRVIQVPPTNYNNPSTISFMEKALLNQSYENDNINTRLTRLEENMFGEPVNGTISQRYNNLTSAFNYNNPSPYSTYNSFCNTPYSVETARKLNIVNKLANFLGGTSTGVSPELTDYGFDESYTTPYGFGYSRRNNGSGLGVRIMD